MSARIAGAAAALAFALAACGGSAAVRAGSTTGATARATASASATASPSSAAPSKGDAPSTRGTVAAGRATQTPAQGTIPLTLTIARSCARPGDVMEARVETEPGAQIALATSYNDHQFQPDFTWVQSDMNTTGEHTWRWTLRPGTPIGPAKVTAVAGKEGKGANATAEFRVASSC